MILFVSNLFETLIFRALQGFKYKLETNGGKYAYRDITQKNK